MKRISILLIPIFLLGHTLHAQCNAAFQTITDTTVAKFITTDSLQENTSLWFFGDGSYSSEGYFKTMPSAIEHIYKNTGIYTVIHYVYNASSNCFDSAIQHISITDKITKKDSISPCHASFEYYKNGDFDNKIFSFYSTYNSQDDISSFTWTIDGIIASTSSYFSNKLSPDTNHTICLDIITPKGCRSSCCKDFFIKDTLKCNKNLSFTTTTSSWDKRTVTFLSNQDSTNGISYKWELGYWNEIISTEQKPVYTFTYGGSYSVKLTIYDSLTNCYDTIRQTINVFDTCDTFFASFKYTTMPNGTVSFIAESNTTITSANWNIYSNIYNDSSMSFMMIYDTSFSNTNNPVYTFRDSGYKHILLSIQNSIGCWKYYDEVIYVNKTLARPLGSLTAYPNPVNGSLVTIKINLEKADRIQYQVCDLNGNILYQGQQQGFEGDNAIKIPVQSLNKGQYFVKVSFNDTISNSIFQKL